MVVLTDSRGDYSTCRSDEVSLCEFHVNGARAVSEQGPGCCPEIDDVMVLAS